MPRLRTLLSARSRCADRPDSDPMMLRRLRDSLVLNHSGAWHRLGLVHCLLWLGVYRCDCSHGGFGD